MSIFKTNLRSGVAQLAQFTGIGKGTKPAAKPARVTPFVTIGGVRQAAAAKPAAEENPDNTPPADDADDDEAMEDDDYGADAPNDDDSPEEIEAKRARRVARRARRMKDKNPPPADDPPPVKNDDPSPPDEEVEDADDGDAEMRGNSPAAQARRRERARCAAIFAAEAAAANVDLAAHLAFNTSLTRGQAIATLSAAPVAEKRGELSNAMRGYATQRPGAPGTPKPQGAALAASWDHAFDEVTAYRGARKK